MSHVRSTGSNPNTNKNSYFFAIFDSKIIEIKKQMETTGMSGVQRV